LKRPRAISIPITMRRPTDGPIDQPVPIISDGDTSGSACWRCSDAPCVKLSSEKLSPPKIQKLGSIAANSSVCPVDAIKIDESGQPQIDSKLCIGCGLCLSNCPVSAIYLDAGSGVAVVTSGSTGANLEKENSFNSRDQLSAKIKNETPAPNQLTKQIHLFHKEFLSGRSPALNITSRILVRNSLIALGMSAALRNQGSNSLLSEIVAEEEGRTYLIEIETRDDTLDAFRRLLSASAKALGGLGVEQDQISLVMILPQLPNRRVDLYRLIGDAKKYLGLRILVVPFAALTAAVILKKRGFEKTFGNFLVEEGQESLVKVANDALGLSLSEELGLSPLK